MGWKLNGLLLLLAFAAPACLAGEVLARGMDTAKTKDAPPPGYRLTSVPITIGSGKNPALQARTHVDIYAILTIKPGETGSTKPETAVARLSENAIVVAMDPVLNDARTVASSGYPTAPTPTPASAATPKETWVSLWVPGEDVDNILLARELSSEMNTQFLCVINPSAEASEEPSSARRLVTASDFLNNLRSGKRGAKRDEPVATAAPEAKHEPKPESRPVIEGIAATAPVPVPAAAAVPAAVPAAAPHLAAATAPAPAMLAPGLKLAERLPDGLIRIDGSSTVFPIAKLLKQEFNKAYPNVRIELKGEVKGEAPAGTGGGFKKFVVGETDISNASRFIKDAEVEKAAKAGIEFFEIPVAWDGLTVAVSKQNDWVDSLTVTELKEMWKPGSQMKTWRDVRPTFPLRPLILAGAGSDSGTFDYFTEAIVGESRMSRMDYMASEDDELVVKALLRDSNALGYFGLAYFEEHKDKLKALAIDSGKGPVSPSAETVASGAYSPLSRPLFIYVTASAAKRADVDGFIKYVLTQAGPLARKAGYIPFPDVYYAAAAKRYLQGTKGTVQQKTLPGASLRVLLGVAEK